MLAGIDIENLESARSLGTRAVCHRAGARRGPGRRCSVRPRERSTSQQARRQRMSAGSGTDAGGGSSTGPPVRYELDGRIGRLTLDRPERGNAITPALTAELLACVERADLDPAVHVLALSGSGTGFCGGYDLVDSAEGMGAAAQEPPTLAAAGPLAGSPLDPAVIASNHDPSKTWDPAIDYAMMSRNVRAFMSLFHCGKPVVCVVHGFCVAGGTDMALCSDLLLIAEDAKIGYPPARVWGSPTTALWAHRIGVQRAKRLLFTGDSLSGREALEWGLAIEAPPAEQLQERAEVLLERIARMPLNQLVLMKLLVNQTLYAQGLHATQVLGTVFDGITRHTPEGYAFQRRAAEAGFRQAVRERDEPFGDAGRSSFKG
jgi:enoyl-CoA hydratase